jgi:hypothetical protein
VEVVMATARVYVVTIKNESGDEWQLCFDKKPTREALRRECENVSPDDFEAADIGQGMGYLRVDGEGFQSMRPSE